MTWPKSRPVLTAEEQAVVDDWVEVFLTTLKDSRFASVNKFDHSFPARSASATLRTLEIGAGTGSHVGFEPSGEYVALEASEELASQIPRREGLSVVVADCEQRLPWDDDWFDRVLAIHILEHLYNLPAALDEVARVLRPGGIFGVVIPCEGGHLYSLGRSLTTKRMFERRYDVPYEVMIQYEHCNTAKEVLAELGVRFRTVRRTFYPLRIPAVDLNLVVGIEMTI
ncbi:MAG TPA: class I SAM-dependent methyltransferase [Acidimicrobiales bacterium]|nr:class I SAM-dependent methyltransferase [Acidimicrobiales bacterium]